MKERLKRTQGRGTGGFTLVELVVVIAILGILAGVGTVGYSGYMKAAQKKADQTLVANIIRAIEVGTNSTMYVSDDSFKMAQISYPVGFITLTADATKDSQVTVSNTLRGGADHSPCNFVEIPNVIVRTAHTLNSGCPKNDTGTYYTISDPDTVRYCTAHGPSAVTENVGGQEYVSAVSHKGTNLVFGCVGHDWNKTPSTYPDGAVILSNQEAVCLEKSAGLCEYAYAYQNDTFTGTTSVGAAVSGNTLYDAIEAAFGDVKTLKLQYNGWLSDEGADYATFYTAAPQVMDSIEDLTDKLVIASNSLGQSTLGLSKDYGSGEEVLLGVANTIASNMSEDDWMQQWRGAADATWDSYGFGLGGRENYSAARVGYNTAFASYLESRGVETAYVNAVKDFYSQDLVLAKLPGLICTDAFTDSETKLKDQIGNDAAFEQIAALFEEYKTSGACEENGRVFYQVICSFNDTADIAERQVEDGKYGSIYGYYNSYVDEISALYSAAQTAAGDGIVIIVTVENGEVMCDVSPSAADLRKAD